MVAVVMASLVLPARRASAEVTFNQRMLELLNRERAANGLPALAADPSLAAVAEDQPYNGCGFTVYGRAKDMGVRNYFSHSILGCALQGVTSILTSTGILFSGSGENIAWMNGTTDPVVAANNLHGQLMNSPNHRANILNARFTRVGVGSWHTSPGQTWSGGGYALANAWIAAQVFAGGTVPVTTAPTTTVPPTPTGSVSPAIMGFGSRVVGTPSEAQAVTLTNSGSGTLNVSSTKLGGTHVADFAIASNTCGTTVAAGRSCSIAIRFTPGAVGARSASLIVSDNAIGSPRTVTLGGTGTAAPFPVKPINPGELVKVTSSPDGRPMNDFDGDGTTDLAVFRPASGGWYLRTATPRVVAWGQEGDIPVPGDYNGDGTTDLAVYRPANNTWYLRTPTAQFVVWGEAGDIPVPGDYDGNGTTDIAVFRPSTGTWFLRTASPTAVVWGQNGDIPVPGDYDKNGAVDIAVFRPSNNAWYLRTTTPQFVQWGQAGDIPAPGDYDGNGTTDVAIFRPSNGTWYLRTASPTAVVWGQSGDVPVAGDYDGNGTTDIAVFRPGNSSWYLGTPTPSFVT